MNLDFSALKRNRSLASTNLIQKIEEQSSNIYKDDDRFWTCQKDKAGNGLAVIRFLPAPGDEDFPWVKYYRHAFKGPTGKWYIENSRTTLNEPDPLAELNNKLWNSGFDSDKDLCRKQRRTTTFISNIYVVKDPENPENEGKVFLFKYGKKIFDKIQQMLQPDAALGEEPVNVFDLWDGANFKLKIRKVEGQINYDSSLFESPSPLSDDDAKLEAIWKQEHSLKQFLEPSNFKSYEELKKRLELVLNDVQPKDESVTEEEEQVAIPPKKTERKFEEAPKKKEVVQEAEAPAPKYGEASTDDDDDAAIMTYFSQLGKNG